MQSTNNYDNITKMLKALEYLRVRLSQDGKECPIQKATFFLNIILEEGLTQDELRESQGFHQTTVSRNIKELSISKKWDIYTETYVRHGCGLVVTEPNEYNRRKHSVFLSSRGKKVARDLANILY